MHEDKKNGQPRRNIVKGSHLTTKMDCLEILEGSSVQIPSTA